MDLTKDYPRSVKAKIAGVVMVARATDKGKAVLEGKNGEYNYNCPMDKGVFEFLGIDSEKYLDVIKNAKSDSDIENYVKEHAARKSPQQIEEFNANFVKHAPEPGSDVEQYFLTTRNQVAPGRDDVTTWADLLDLEEKRDVPRTAAV